MKPALWGTPLELRPNRKEKISLTENENKMIGDTTKVIFLDFDGPVIPMRAWAWNKHCSKKRWHEGDHRIHIKKMDPCAVYMILDILEKTGAKLVISSSWRRLGRDRIVDVLGFNEIPESTLHDDWRTTVESEEPLDHPVSHLGRPERIRNWIKNHQEITHWAWLDDMNMDLPNGIHVDTWNGMMYIHHRKMAHLLGYEPFPFITQKEQEQEGDDTDASE